MLSGRVSLKGGICDECFRVVFPSRAGSAASARTCFVVVSVGCLSRVVVGSFWFCSSFSTSTSQRTLTNMGSPTRRQRSYIPVGMPSPMSSDSGSTSLFDRDLTRISSSSCSLRRDAASRRVQNRDGTTLALNCPAGARESALRASSLPSGPLLPTRSRARLGIHFLPPSAHR